MKLTIGIVVLVAIAVWLNRCQPQPQPQTIYSKYSWGKVVLHPTQGDVLKWKDVKVQFSPDPKLNPCKGDPKDPVSECAIEVQTGTFLYDCDPSTPCEDPEVEVGTEARPPIEASPGTAPQGAGPAVVATRANKRVYISCKDNTLTLKDPSTNANSGMDNVVFLTVGDPSESNTPTDWKSTLSTPNGCSGQTDFNSAHQQCMLDAAAGTTLKYTVTSVRCPMGSGATGYINVK